METENKIKAKRTLEEAIRYMGNAYRELKLSDRNGKVYQDVKHMRVACGTAYLATLKAVDGIFLLRGISKLKRKASIEYYEIGLAQIDKKMLTSLNIAYRILHIDGYYDGFNDIKTIKRGFEEADELIKKLKIAVGV
jgi:hypothetical protein